MPALYEIYNAFEIKIPSSIKEGWDNVGLIVGDLNCEINGAIVALDCTMNVIDEAISKNANLIITHHPFIFDGVKNIDFSSPFGKKLEKLIKNNINVLSLHTNFDKASMGTGDILSNTLGLTNIKNLTEDEFSLGKVGEISPCTLKELLNLVKDKLNLSSVKYVGNDDAIVKKVALVPGSGSEFYIDAYKNNADVFITAEVKHHIGIECMELGMAIVDAGHFETENISLITLKEIAEKFVKTEISESYKKLFKYI